MTGRLRSRSTTVLVLGLLGLAGGSLSADSHGRLADHVVLISLDGLRPEFYLDPVWPAPMLRQMRLEGAHARGVESVFPSVTYPSHTTILTGVRPARHGVHYNSPFEPGGQSGRWYWEAEKIRVPTLWELAKEAGLKTANLGWPVSVGAPVDWNVPEVWSLEPDAGPVDATRRATRPPGLLEEIEREATGRLTGENFTMDRVTRDDRVGDAAAYLLTKYRPNLMTVHLIEADHFQHEEGREGTMVSRAVAASDRAIAQIVEAAEAAGMLERTAFIVTGDHGHSDVHTRIAPNVWLVEAGLLEPARDRGDWRAAFLVTGASAFLHLRDPNDREAVELARRKLDMLPAPVRDLFRIVDVDELALRGAAPEAELALAPKPGVNVSSSTRPPAIRPDSGATHGYPPEEPEMLTGFLGWGAGFRPGAAASRLELVDIAPLVALLLDLPFEGGEGAAPIGFLAAEE